jgi:hypothetical protein
VPHLYQHHFVHHKSHINCPEREHGSPALEDGINYLNCWSAYVNVCKVEFNVRLDISHIGIFNDIVPVTCYIAPNGRIKCKNELEVRKCRKLHISNSVFRPQCTLINFVLILRLNSDYLLKEL